MLKELKEHTFSRFFRKLFYDITKKFATKKIESVIWLGYLKDVRRANKHAHHNETCFQRVLVIIIFSISRRNWKINTLHCLLMTSQSAISFEWFSMKNGCHGNTHMNKPIANLRAKCKKWKLKNHCKCIARIVNNNSGKGFLSKRVWKKAKSAITI